MLARIALFELRYQLRRPIALISFLVFAAIAFGLAAIFDVVTLLIIIALLRTRPTPAPAAAAGGQPAVGARAAVRVPDIPDADAD